MHSASHLRDRAFTGPHFLQSQAPRGMWLQFLLTNFRPVCELPLSPWTQSSCVRLWRLLHLPPPLHRPVPCDSPVLSYNPHRLTVCQLNHTWGSFTNRKGMGEGRRQKKPSTSFSPVQGTGSAPPTPGDAQWPALSECRGLILPCNALARPRCVSAQSSLSFFFSFPTSLLPWI